MKRSALVVAFIAILTLPAIAIAAGSAPIAEPSSGGAQMGASVSIVDFAFQPGYAVVSAGSTVSWYNAGAAPHTVTSSSGVFDSGTIGSGGGFSTTFWTPGTYSYYCAIHPSMVGTIQVN
jgi:plastocyanin